MASVNIPLQSLTSLQLLKNYMPSGLLTDALNYQETNYSILMHTYAYQFNNLFNFLDTLLNNFLPIEGSDTTFVNLWKLTTELDKNYDLPIQFSKNPEDRQVQWNWIQYVFYKFQQINNVADINQCLIDLDIEVTCYRYDDAPTIMKTTLETINGSAFTDTYAIYVFDITNYSQSDEREGFPYDFPIDFYLGFDKLRLQTFLSRLIPVYCLPLYYEGE